MAGDKSRDVSLDEYIRLIRTEPEMPFNLTDAAMERLLCLAYEVSSVEDLRDRTFNSLYDYDAFVLPALKECHYQP